MLRKMMRKRLASRVFSLFLRYSELKRPGADDNTEQLIDLIDLMAVILAAEERAYYSPK